jgi:L-Ala-D/L-Glu epimerase / N-acetyl-D-glutamate racemase
MKLARMEVAPRRVRLTVPYRIAGRSFDTADMVFVIVRDETGAAGYGSASPVPPLTGDDYDAAAFALERAIRPALLDTDVSDLDAAVARAAAASPAARSALAAADIALHDLHARRCGVPLVEMLGGARRRLLTSVTVGIGEPDVMVAAARRHVERGFRILKVKIGEDAAMDLARLRAIRDAVGDGVAIRVDANEGYSAGDALAVAGRMAELGIELFEQPVAAARVGDLGAVARAAPAPVIADEPVKLAADLEPLVAAGAATGANIKLMKCGGLAEARRIDAALARAGWRALVGCMDESRASIAAAAHFAASAHSVEWIDLDGHLDLASDPFTGGFEIDDGEIVLGAAPGLGVTFAGF